MRAGLMRAIVTVETPAPDSNALNEIGDTWVAVPDYSGIHARKRFVRGSEQALPSGEVGLTVTEFWVRYKPGHGIDNSCRVVEGAIVFDVQTVDNVGNRNRELRLVCRELSRKATTGL